MANSKVVFVAFAIEDERMRDLLKGQSLNTSSPFDYIDMSVKEAYETDWKSKVHTRIRRSNGMIALISANSIDSEGQQWEIECARTEGVPILPLWIYTDDRTAVPGLSPEVWTWNAVSDFIDAL